MREFLHDAWRENLGLRVAIIFNALLLMGAVGAMPFDHRTLLGLNVWVKPLKFDLSVLIYLPMVGALLAGLGRFRRMRTVIGWGVGLAMIFENGIISLQAARGVRSHMNFATPRDAMLFAAMGLLVALNTVLVVWLLGLWCATRSAWPVAAAWGARLGLLAMFAGSLEGVLMVVRYQAHTIGAKDGGPGLPFLNWSMGHGDLRVAHFFALHALELQPLTGWALSRTRWPARAQVAAVFGVAAVYFGVVWALFRQAVAGRPVVG